MDIISVREYFKIRKPKAVTAIFGATPNDVYFGSSTWSSNELTITHEALHSLTRMTDVELANELFGLKLDAWADGEKASIAISEGLQSAGCINVKK